MKPIELLGHVDEQHRLSAVVPDGVRPGPVKLALMVPSDAPAGALEDDADMQWASGIASEWSADLNEPAQDIYTLSDGEPIDEQR